MAKRKLSNKEKKRRYTQSELEKTAVPLEAGKPILVIDTSTLINAPIENVGRIDDILKDLKGG